MRLPLLTLALAVAHLGTVLAQSIGFTVFPQQVVTGLTYSVAWSSNGQPATIELLRNGVREDRLFTSDGPINSFQWSVQDDYTGGTNYALQISSGGSTSLTKDIWVIEDEDGLVVSGSRITAPSPTPSVDLASITGTALQTSATNSASGTSMSTASTLRETSVPSPSSSSTGSNTDRNNSSQTLSGPILAGIIIGVLGAAIVAGTGVWLCMRKRFALKKSYSDLNRIGSFLALGRHGRTSRTIKGTSPEVSNYPSDKHELTSGGVIETPELPGEMFAPWSVSGRGRFYSGASLGENSMSGNSEESSIARKDHSASTMTEDVRYELPANSIHRLEM